MGGETHQDGVEGGAGNGGLSPSLRTPCLNGRKEGTVARA